MALPLLSSSYFEQPASSGQVSSKTADLIAAEGDSLAKRIEAQSYNLDAKNLAPPITDLYSSAYQKIAAGDMTGFADMQKARSLAIGNPILMKTMDQADLIAGHLASTVIAADKGQSTQEFQMKKQEEMNKAIADRQQASQESALNRTQLQLEGSENRQDERQAFGLWKTATDNYDAQNRAELKQYNAEKTLYDKQVEAWNTNQKMGVQTQQPVAPKEPKPGPAPKLSDYRTSQKRSSSPSTTLPSQGLQIGGSSQLEMPDLPSVEGVTGAGATGLIPQDVPTNPKSGPSSTVPTPPPTSVPTPVPSAAATPLPSAAVPYTPPTESTDADVPAIPPTPAGSKPDAHEPFSVQMGNRVTKGEPWQGMIFGLDPDTGAGAEITLRHEPAEVTKVTTDTGTGKNEIDLKPSKKMEEARDALSELDTVQGGQFGQWWALQSRLGHKVSIDYLPNIDPKNKDQSFVARSAGQTFSDKDGNVIHMSKDDRDNLKIINHAAHSGVLQVSFPDIKDEQKKALRQKTIDMGATNPAAFNYNQANDFMVHHGIEQITPAEINKRAEEMRLARATTAQTASKQTMDEQAKQEAYSQGFRDPEFDKKIADDKAQVTNSEKRAREIPKEIESVNQQIETLKKTTGGSLSAAQFQQVKDMNRKIWDLEKDLNEHYLILRQKRTDQPITQFGAM